MNASPTPSGAAIGARIPKSRPLWAILTPLLTATIAFQLNASMLSPVLVTMGQELNASITEISLTNSLGFLSMAIFALFVPRFSDIAGRKRVLIWLLGGLALGTVICALAPNVPVLAIGRIVMGISGPILAISILLLRAEVTDPIRFATLAGLITAVNGGIAGLDVLLSGWIATHWGFRPVFFTMTAIALIALLLIIIGARESRPFPTARMDWPGALLLALALAAAMQAFTEAGALAAAQWWLVALYLIVALVAAFLFARRQTKSAEPFIPLDALKDRSSIFLLMTTLTTLTAEFALINELIPALAQDTEHGFGLSPQNTALMLLTPFALVGWIVGPFAGRAAATIGYRTVLHVGLTGTLLVFLGLALVGTRSLGLLIAGTVLVGIFYAGIVNIMLGTMAVVLAPASHPGTLPGLNSGMFNLGAGLSFVFIPALQVAGGPVQGYPWGMWAAVVLATLALALSFGITKNPKAS